MVKPQPGTAGDARAPIESDCAWAFWLAALLGVVLVAAKAACFESPEHWTLAHVGHLLLVTLVASGADVVYAAALGLLSWLALWMVRRRPGLRRWMLRAVIAVFVISVFYGILNVKIFQYMRMPLTYTLLYLAGDVTNMESSVLVYATPTVIAALTLVPLMYVAAAWAGVKYAVPRGRWRLAGPLVMLLLVGAWYPWSVGRVHAGLITFRDGRRIIDNPHYALASSFVRSWVGDEGVAFTEGFPEADLDDFRIVSERPPGAGDPTPSLKHRPRNVIVVISESVGVQNLSLYGSSFDTWPNLQREASNALVFDNYYTHIGNSANSLISLLMSVYTAPLDYHEVSVERPRMKGVSVADALKPLGYRTAFVSAADNTFANAGEFLKGRGFDAVWDYRESGCQKHFSWGVADHCMVDMILRFIDQRPDAPFCIYGWTMGTHHSYAPYPGEPMIMFDTRQPRWGQSWWDLNRYLNGLREEDRQVERLLNELRRRGLADDTLVVITGDHGEAFGWPHKSYGHCGSVYEQETHVPLVLWNPRMFKGAGRSQTVGAHVDLAPTVLDALGVKLPATWQGASLLSPHARGRAYMHGVMNDKRLAVREGKLKYILTVNTGDEELYDLAADPLEMNNLAPERPAVAKRLRQRLAAWVEYQRRLEKTW